FILECEINNTKYQMFFKNKIIYNSRNVTDKFNKYEVCLCFLFKDQLNIIFSDKKELEIYNNKIIVDSLLNKISNIDAVNNFKVIPTIHIHNEVYMTLKLYINFDPFGIEITSVNDFLSCYFNTNAFNINNHFYILNSKNFDKMSNKLVRLIKNFKINENKIYFDLNVFDDLYDIFNRSIFVTTDFKTNKYYFSKEKLPLLFTVKNNTLSISNFNYLLISSSYNSYCLFDNKIYILKNKKLFFLLEFIKENGNHFDLGLKEEQLTINLFIELSSYFTNSDFNMNTNIDTLVSYKDNQLYIGYQLYINKDTFFGKKNEYISFLTDLSDFNSGGVFYITDIEKICKFLKHDIEVLKKFGEINLDQSLNNFVIKNLNDITFSVRLNNTANILEVLYDERYISSQDFEKIMITYKVGKKFVEINNEIFELDYNKLAQIEKIIEFSKTDHLSIINSLFLDSYYKDYLSFDENTASFINTFKNFESIDILTNSNNYSLREYQISGVKWMKVLHDFKLGGILADDMGLGKTLQVISLIENIKDDKILIVSPTSLLYNWYNEFEKFSPNSKVCMIQNNAQSQMLEYDLEKYKVILVSYDTLRTNIDLFDKHFYTSVFLDEAQYIKNPNTLKSLAVKRLKSNSKFCLTGTPIENSALDLFSLFDFILPNYLFDKKTFISHYNDLDSNTLKLEELTVKTNPFILRRLKQNVLDLEEKIETTIYSEMSNEELNLYNSYLKDAKEKIQDSKNKFVDILSTITRLRQFACDPRLFIDTELVGSKMKLLYEVISEKVADGKKILIFSQFTSIFSFIEEYLEKENIGYLKLTGQVQNSKRLELVDKFNEDEKVSIFLISLKAGGVGLNLTSASVVIHYDPWWNVSAMNQATDRTYRIGQKNAVHVIKMISKNTIEEKILKLQDQKLKLSNNIISSDIDKDLSLDLLKELLE
ncbi:MAG: SNF2-related protein, partial [Anaeroplasmataceae bacterium]